MVRYGILAYGKVSAKLELRELSTYQDVSGSICERSLFVTMKIDSDWNEIGDSGCEYLVQTDWPNLEDIELGI